MKEFIILIDQNYYLNCKVMYTFFYCLVKKAYLQHSSKHIQKFYSEKEK